MTQDQATTFKIFDAFAGDQAGSQEGAGGQLNFVPWSNFGKGQPETQPATLAKLDQEKHQSERDRLLAEVEQKRQEAMAELQAREDAVNAKAQEIAEKEKAIADMMTEIQEKEMYLKSLSQLMQEVEEMKKGYWLENAEEIIRFAVDLVEKMVMERLDEKPEILSNQIRAVLEEMKIEEPVLIHLSAGDLKLLKASQTQEVVEVLQNDQIKWVPDLRLKRGEVYIDTSQYRLDASLKTALQNLEEDLLEGQEKDKTVSEMEAQNKSQKKDEDA